MSDIDFDELDRAVNSLIKSNPIPNITVPGEVKEKVLNIKTQSPIQSDSLNSQPAIKPIQSAPLSPILERRSGGQFMDVVHPSSNMRSSTPLTMPGRDTARQQSAAPIQPARNTTDITPPVSQPKADVNAVPADVATDSPFISDAKVEKRPLGAFSNDTPVNTTTPTIPNPNVASPSPTTPAMPADPSATPITPPAPAAVAPNIPTTRDEEAPSGSSTNVVNTSNESAKSAVNAEAPLPAELQSDLLLIESGNASDVDETLSDDNLATAATVAATSSINQQYAEKPSTGDNTSGAIYDTKSYHKAIGGAASKKPNRPIWMWALWLVILLVVGAGAGAAIFWFVLK